MEKKILVTGGDERQIYLAEALRKAEFEVTFVNYLEQLSKEKIEKLLTAPSTFGLQGNRITVVKNDEEKR